MKTDEPPTRPFTLRLADPNADNGVMADEPTASLAEFAAANPLRRVGCFVCNLPDDVRSQMETAKKNRTASYPTMVAWLRANGFDDATKGRIERHWQDGCVIP